MSAISESPTILRPAVGAQVHPSGVSYRVWAPDHPAVAVEIRRRDGSSATLEAGAEPRGYFHVEDPLGHAGDRYGFRLAGGAVVPDPVSRFQPEGVHALSQCVDPAAFRWRCDSWRRPRWRGQSIYELHVGTFTPAGTFAAAIGRLEHVAALGVEAIEIMPVADFPGRRNWGYDGVSLYAPARCYGEPDDLRRLVDAAHERGLGAILDVVYNHLGPDGNYLSRFAGAYFHPDRHTPWGQAFNLSGPHSAPVRGYFTGNIACWLDEYRFDGLRLDATHALEDDPAQPLLGEIAAAAHARGAFVIAEDERNTCEILRRPDGSGAGLDAVWADDFHHEIRVALTGIQQSYFKSYRGSPEEIAATLQHGWFYRGQPYRSWRDRARGEPGDHLPARAFVHCIENHDQIGNRAQGERLEHLIGCAAFRAASALLCLGPYPPLLFMGQEWAAGTPFLFFTDHAGDLGRLVSAGRRKEFAGDAWSGAIAMEEVPDPQDDETFHRSKLAWDELSMYPHASVLELYRNCLRHRSEWLHGEATERPAWAAAAIDRVIAIRYARPDVPDRLVLSSLHGDARLAFAPHALLRPPPGSGWHLVLDSNRIGPAAGESGTAVIWTGAEDPTMETLVFAAPATVLLVAEPRTARHHA